MRTIFLQLCTFYAIYAWENPIPAALLQPRDFNPHPYRKDKAFLIALFDENNQFQDKENDRELLRRFQNTGPIRFPENIDDPQLKQQQSEQQRRIVSHIIEKQSLIPIPYEKIASSYRHEQLQRFSGNDHEIPQIFSALANHAKKVQNNEFQRKTHISLIQRHNKINANYRHKEIDQIKTATSKHENKHYKFSYAVKDRQSGDDFSHTQKQENGAVHGSYKTVLPDKRVQIVKYTADDIHGYRAEVSYENPAKEQDHRWSVEQNHRFTSVTPYGINHRSPQVISFLPSTSSSSRHY